MNFTLGFSPCPNDTFIFDALVNKKIDTGDIDFTVRLEDVETLNHLARQGELDFTKISYGALPVVIHRYKMLNSGGALGKGVGPLLISKQPVSPEAVAQHTIVIPGEHTTAHLLFSLAFPQAKNKIFKRYDEIESSVLASVGDVLGVIIHENRFTYMDKGLHKVLDLGQYWEEKMQLPIPLGGIAGKRSIAEPVLARVDGLIRQSIQYAFAHYPLITDYVKQHSQEMDPEVMKKHIDLYVNQYSVTLGEGGRAAVEKFMEIYQGLHQLPVQNMPQSEIFVREELLHEDLL